MDRESLILSALNHYWHDANDQVSNGGWAPLGDIEKKLLEERMKMCEELMAEMEEFKPLEGFKTYRHSQNPKEKELHDKFIDWYLGPSATNIDKLVFPTLDNAQTIPADRLSNREIRIVITMVQWMGTPLGQSLLSECGFELKKDDK